MMFAAMSRMLFRNLDRSVISSGTVLMIFFSALDLAMSSLSSAVYIRGKTGMRA